MKLSYRAEPNSINPSSPEWYQIDDGELETLTLDNILEYEKDIYASLMEYAAKIKHGGTLIIDGVYLLGIARDYVMSKTLDLATAVKLIYDGRINSADPLTLCKQLESRGFTTVIKRINQYDYHLEFTRN